MMVGMSGESSVTKHRRKGRTVGQHSIYNMSLAWASVLSKLVMFVEEYLLRRGYVGRGVGGDH